ncbi:MAG: SMC family ATPase [Cyanobacteria bacterium P01_D01_bin.128]
MHVYQSAAMIPQRLTLKNFLSYRSTTLDFSRLHVACVCGPNGAGKSSLLEAIAWAVWGQSRVGVEDDVVHLGMDEAQVDFTFEHQRRVYRIIRTRRRSQSSALEFQVKTESGFRALTQRGMRATQGLINQHLRLDYDTFVNSAYLRQGKADAFMLKRPSERKQILADLLKLNQYDRLAEKAKEQARDAKAEVKLLSEAVEQLEDRVAERSAIAAACREIAQQLANAEQQQLDQQAQLQDWQRQQQQRQAWQQQQVLLQQQQQHLTGDLERLQRALSTLDQQRHQLEAIVAESEAIAAGYQKLHQIQAEEAAYNHRFHTYRQVQTKRSELSQRLQQQQQALQQRQQQAQLALQLLDQQLGETEQILAKADDIQAAQAQLHKAQLQLNHYDKLQLTVTPLTRRRSELQHQLDCTQAQLRAKVDALDAAAADLQTQQGQQPQLRQAVVEVTHAVNYLETRRAYLEQVREQGIERRSLMERLQANQRSAEVQLAQLDQKIQMLTHPEAPCPVCDRPLDRTHWQLVQHRHQAERSDLQDQVWVIREQLAAAEKEIQVLRDEYRVIEADLEKYGAVLERRGQLHAQVQSTTHLTARLETLSAEKAQLENRLQRNRYAGDLQEELTWIDQQLAELDYDDRDHALIRGQVNRLRWAEVKARDLQQAQHRRDSLLVQRPEHVAKAEALEKELNAIAHGVLQQQIDQLSQQLHTLDYHLDQHQQLRDALVRARPWQERHRELSQAQQQLPLLHQQRQQQLEQIQQQQTKQRSLNQQLQQLTVQLAQCPDGQDAITQLEATLAQHQHQREVALAQQGRLQQQLAELEQQQAQLDQQHQALEAARQRSRIYSELAHAFGRNGIQALMIENILPQLEAETNQILSRLSANQLHVQFITQRSGRRKTTVIDTLEILIADARGTRPYETYSGGEAFRVNFAIRLALARLLSQRSGTPLQLLIIDEGFGTQDRQGCDRLIASINAIASDFACILTVTHVPHFREAFQTRIDVIKTETGSQIQVSL